MPVNARSAHDVIVDGQAGAFDANNIDPYYKSTFILPQLVPLHSIDRGAKASWDDKIDDD